MDDEGHVQRLPQQVAFIKCAFEFGRRDALSVSPKPQPLEQWRPEARSAYVYAKFLTAPRNVTPREISLIDMPLFAGLLPEGGEGNSGPRQSTARRDRLLRD